MMRMSVSVISEYRIGYRYRLILLLNISYRNNRLIWISVQHYYKYRDQKHDSVLWPRTTMIDKCVFYRNQAKMHSYSVPL